MTKKMPAEIDPAGILSSPGKSKTLQDRRVNARPWPAKWPNFMHRAISDALSLRSGCRSFSEKVGRHVKD
jgi:hypothetical protein